jgi:hypothetical protein
MFHQNTQTIQWLWIGKKLLFFSDPHISLKQAEIVLPARIGFKLNLYYAIRIKDADIILIRYIIIMVIIICT